MALGLVDGADRRAADGPSTFLHQFDPDGRSGRGDLHDHRRAQRLRADQVALPRREHLLRHAASLLLHPLPDRTDPDGAHSRYSRHRRFDLGSDPGSCGLRYRLHDALFPQLLRGLPDRAGACRADRRRQLLPDIPADIAAVVRADHRRFGHLAVHQYLERLPVRGLVLRAVFDADDGGSQQSRELVNGGSRNTMSTSPARSSPPCQRSSSTSCPAAISSAG